MSLDPVRVEDSRAWLAKADLDLRSARVDIAAEPPILGDALFHCQQAVEKGLKAFLTWHDQPFRKIHDRVELGGQCASLDQSLEAVVRPAVRLTEYAWRFRYPGDVPEPARAEVDAALALVGAVLAAVEQRLPMEARPRQ
ncbi:MAG: HEPN domain-containing protein [Gemmatimonadales bacterium]